MKLSGTDRYWTLDGMRGVAAIMVALLHLQPSAVPHGSLAVDFFFALSGLVLARSYEGRLRQGMRVYKFTELRVLRLWPLFVLGVLLGSAYGAQQIIRNTAMHPKAIIFVPSILSNLFMIPSPLTSNLYTANPVFWSIFTELLVNLAFAIVLWRARTSVLSGLALGFAVLLAITVQSSGDADGGALWATLPQGLVRTGLSFIIGMIVARASANWERRAGLVSPAIAAVLCATFLMPFIALNGAYDMLMIIAVFPVLLSLGARFDPPAALVGSFAFLGDISYALYATHAPISFAMRNMAGRLNLPPIALAVPFLLVSIAIAVAATRLWDEPVRSYLSRRLALRRSAMPVVV